MKRTLLLLAALVLAMPLFGVGGHDAVLTEAGTFYSIEVATLDANSIPPKTALELTRQAGDEVTTEIVPGSDEYGINFEPSLYWDEESDTLLLFWVRMPSMMSSEILFVSRDEDGWSQPTSIDNGMFRFRKNLRIAATHYYHAVDEEGEPVTLPGLAIHAVWWDEHSAGVDTQYAILGFEDGVVTSIERFTLVDLIDRTELQATILHPDFDRTFFQNPTITVTPGSDAVEVIFGDWDFNVLHKLDLPPISLNGVLTIPIGVRDSEPIRPEYEFAGANASTGPVQFIAGAPGTGQLAAYWKTEGGVIFSRYRDGEWSETREVMMSEHVSERDAIQGLRRLLGRD